MKIPLSYQFTDFDCAPITFLNAFRYLFGHTVTEPEMIKAIYSHSLDLPDNNGKSGKGGTSVAAVKRLTDWLTAYSEQNGLGFTCTFFLEDQVDFIKNRAIKECLEQGGVCITTVCISEGIYHYVLVVELDADHVYFFDPYYTEERQAGDEIEYVDDKPEKYNRKVKLDRFLDFGETFYSLGKQERRKLIFLNK